MEEEKLYPTVGFNSRDAIVETNLGEEDYAYDMRGNNMKAFKLVTAQLKNTINIIYLNYLSIRKFKQFLFF